MPLNEFKDKHISAIARETLDEVPGQVTSFMAMHNIHPNPPQIEQSRSDGLYDNIDHGDEKKDEEINNMAVPTAHYGLPQNPYYNNYPTRNNSNGKEGVFTAPGFGPGS